MDHTRPRVVPSQMWISTTYRAINAHYLAFLVKVFFLLLFKLVEYFGF